LTRFSVPFVQPPGSPKLELFAESESEFFLKVADVQIAFEANGTGPASHVIVHGAGGSTVARRIEVEIAAHAIPKGSDAVSALRIAWRTNSIDRVGMAIGKIDYVCSLLRKRGFRTKSEGLIIQASTISKLRPENTPNCAAVH